jgi:hypothetical protein
MKRESTEIILGRIKISDVPRICPSGYVTEYCPIYHAELLLIPEWSNNAEHFDARFSFYLIGGGYGFSQLGITIG